MDPDFISRIGQVSIAPCPNPRSNIKNECLVTFATKQIRDAVKAGAVNLKGDKTAGVRIDVPCFLSSNFKALEAMGYNLKQTHKDLRRSIKFDDDKLDFFLDFRKNEESKWQRVRPDKAKKVRDTRPRPLGDEPEELTEEELAALFDE